MANKKENFTIPEEILEKLKDYSKTTMVPKSKLVSKLLLEFFNKNETI